MTRFLFILLALYFTIVPSYSAIKGRIDYSIPIDYTKINQEEVESKAEFYYNLALKSKRLDENMTSALNLYTILENAYPENITYALRLGKLYDVLGQNRYAKSQYSRAIGIDKSRPEPYYYFGNYYYDREEYRKALKFYQKAYDNGYSNHRQMLNMLGVVYQKLGDKEKSIQYLECSAALNSNAESDKKIMQIKNADNINKE